MRRIMIITTVIAFAQAIAGFSLPAPQTSKTTTTLRRIQVTAQTIAALPSGKNYVVDLTQRGVIYEFTPKADPIDFNRVRVRTAQGEVAIGSFLETTFLKDKMAGFKYTTQAFSLATRPPGTLQNPPSGTSNIVNCSGEICICNGKLDCEYMASDICGGPIFCATNPITGEVFCGCKAHY